MTTDSSTTIADHISTVLAEQIIRGDLQPGEKLRQDYIAKTFKTSHVPVREAFRRLEARGLAVSEPRRGTRVAAFDLSEIQEVVVMRVALEVLALRHASPLMSQQDLERAEAARIACDEAHDVVSWEARNRAFHQAILAPCKMPRLLSAIDDLHTISARYLFATWRAEWDARTDHDHRAIMNALLRKDIEGAATILHRHLKRMR